MNDLLLFANILLVLALIILMSNPKSDAQPLEQVIKERDALLKQIGTERVEWNEYLARLEAERDLIRSVVHQVATYNDVFHVLPLSMAERIRATLDGTEAFDDEQN
jgi:hypothetical protein